MLSKAMQKALTEQINEEMLSSYLYLSMSSWFKAQNLNGFASWLALQSKEEWSHSMKIYDYIYMHRGAVTLEGIKKPQATWKSPLDVFEAGFKHEQHITDCFNKLTDLAIKEKDHATQIFLQWYVSEQVEEESNFDEIVNMLKLIGDHTGNLFMVDKRLGKRA